jgi:hypothetical protein
MNFLDRFSKNNQISNLMEIRQVRADLFHADGRTDTRKLIVAFRNFAIAPIEDQNELTHDPRMLSVTLITILQQSQISVTS